MPNLTTNEILFEDLVKEHYSYIFNLVARYTGDKWIAEEITQDTFVEAHRNIAKLKTHPEVRAWLIKTAKYNIRDAHNKRKRNNNVDFFDDIPKPPSYKDKYDRIESTELRKVLPTYLKPNEIEIILMFYEQKMSIKDIATTLKISESNCKTRLHRARKKLEKKHVKEYVKEYFENL